MLTGENPVGLRCMECGWCLIAWTLAQQWSLSVMDGWMDVGTIVIIGVDYRSVGDVGCWCDAMFSFWLGR